MKYGGRSTEEGVAVGYYVRLAISVVLAATYLWFAAHAPFTLGFYIAMPTVVAVLITVALDKLRV
jgi:hypothetical protein